MLRQTSQAFARGLVSHVNPTSAGVISCDFETVEHDGLSTFRNVFVTVAAFCIVAASFSVTTASAAHKQKPATLRLKPAFLRWTAGCRAIRGIAGATRSSMGQGSAPIATDRSVEWDFLLSQGEFP
jgi:hypothetical protein